MKKIQLEFIFKPGYINNDKVSYDNIAFYEELSDNYNFEIIDVKKPNLYEEILNISNISSFIK